MKIYLSFFILILLTSCASYSKKEFKTELSILNESNVNIINGKYEAFPFYQFGNQNNWNISDSLRIRNQLRAFELIQNKYHLEKEIDSFNYNIVEFKIINENNLHYKVFLNDSIISEGSYEYKLKKGMIKLKNSYYKCHGLPFILGGCENSRIRLGISKRGNLIINDSYDNYGALLFIIGAGSNSNNTYEYKKIN